MELKNEYKCEIIWQVNLNDQLYYADVYGEYNRRLPKEVAANARVFHLRSSGKGFA